MERIDLDSSPEPEKPGRHTPEWPRALRDALARVPRMAPRFPWGAARRALLLLSLEEPMSLEKFLGLGREEMYGVLYARHYAHAWSFVHYLFSRNDGVIDLLLRGSEPPNVEELEKGWRKHLSELK